MCRVRRATLSPSRRTRRHVRARTTTKRLSHTLKRQNCVQRQQSCTSRVPPSRRPGGDSGSQVEPIARTPSAQCQRSHAHHHHSVSWTGSSFVCQRQSVTTKIRHNGSSEWRVSAAATCCAACAASDWHASATRAAAAVAAAGSRQPAHETTRSLLNTAAHVVAVRSRGVCVYVLPHDRHFNEPCVSRARRKQQERVARMRRLWSAAWMAKSSRCPWPSSR